MYGEPGHHITDEWAARITARVARGDRAALAVFYEAWFDRCYATARSLTRRDEAFCLDVVQDSMLRVIRSLPTLETRTKLEAWMIRTVHSAALDRLRSESRRLAREAARAGHAGQATSTAGTDEAATDELIRAVLAKVQSLPTTDQQLLTLRVAHGRALDATGAATRMTGNAAHGRVRRALQKLRNLFSEHDHG